MASSYYPYATFEKNGYQLAVVEQGTSRALDAPLAPDEERYAAKPGDRVKLIFEYRGPVQPKGSDAAGNAEHLWVEVTDYGDDTLIGRLDSTPQYTALLRSGDAVAFHPKHIIAFGRPEKTR